MKVARRHTQGISLAHGGIVTALADTAATFAAYSAMDGAAELVTVSLAMNFVAPARAGETLVASGRLIHEGARTLVAVVEVKAQRGRLVASGTFTMMRRRGRG